VNDEHGTGNMTSPLGVDNELLEEDGRRGLVIAVEKRFLFFLAPTETVKIN